MSIQFLKLPWLAQLEVLKQLKLDEVYLISLCSERIKRKVQSLNLKPGIVKYHFTENAIWVCAKGSEHDKVIHPVARMRCVVEGPNVDTIKMKLGGKKITCKWSADARQNSIIFLDYHKSKQNLIIDAFHRHMRDLFRFKPRVQIVLFSDYTVKDLALIKDVTDTVLNLEQLTTGKLESILNAHRNQDSILVYSELTGPQFRWNSKLWRMRALGFKSCCNRISEVIANFQGQHLMFDDVVWALEDFIRMIWKWKRREDYLNLKTLTTVAPEDIWIENPIDNTDNLPAGFDLKEWDGKRRPREFIYDPKIINVLPLTVDCSHWKDIQQVGRGKWASILLTQFEFHFFVWEGSEEYV